MFCLILFVVISSLLVVSPTVAKLSLLGQPESRDLPTRVRRGKIPEARGGVARRCEARTTPQHELAGHKFCRCTRRPLPGPRGSAGIGEDASQPSFDGSEVRLCPPPSTRPCAASGGASARKLPLRADEVAGVTIRVAFQVVLVLGLGLPEVANGRNLRHHLARP